MLAAAGILLFLIAYRAADPAVLEAEKTASFEAGRNEVYSEMERRERAEHTEETTIQADIDRMVSIILADAGTGQDNTANRILASMAKNMGFVQGILYRKASRAEKYTPEGEYALTGQVPAGFAKGEGLAGQVAESLQPMVLYDVPEHYFPVASALGNAQPRFLVFVPVVLNGTCTAVIELAAFKRPDSTDLKIINQLTATLGKLFNPTVAA
jgi:GAF domain-containing protein